MIKNLQYMFKSPNVMPGMNPGEEICIDRGLSLYCQELEIPYIVAQIWEGTGEESHITNYVVLEFESKKAVFMDPRPQVIEYILENLVKNESVESS